MLKISETVIVEGKYDKMKLKTVVDCNIISTNGFSIFTDEALQKTIKQAAQKNGIVILTDSDRAGFMIRNFVKNIARDFTVKHAYIPAVSGKERRKDTPSKEGFLGVEGVSDELIIKAFETAGLEPCEAANPITKSDLFMLGLSGGPDSAQLRRSLCEHLELPPRISTNALIDVLNAIYSKDEFVTVFDKFRAENAK